MESFGHVESTWILIAWSNLHGIIWSGGKLPNVKMTGYLASVDSAGYQLFLIESFSFPIFDCGYLTSVQVSIFEFLKANLLFSFFIGLITSIKNVEIMPKSLRNM